MRYFNRSLFFIRDILEGPISKFSFFLDAGMQPFRLVRRKDIYIVACFVEEILRFLATFKKKFYSFSSVDNIFKKVSNALCLSN